MVDNELHIDWIDDEVKKIEESMTSEEIAEEIEKIEKKKKKERMVLPVIVIAILVLSVIVIGLYLILPYI